MSIAKRFRGLVVVDNARERGVLCRKRERHELCLDVFATWSKVRLRNAIDVTKQRARKRERDPTRWKCRGRDTGSCLCLCLFFLLFKEIAKECGSGQRSAFRQSYQETARMRRSQAFFPCARCCPYHGWLNTVDCDLQERMQETKRLHDARRADVIIAK